MSSPTALTLVNRVMRKHRVTDVSTFTGDPLATAVLDLVNESMHEILESVTWDFDVRHDGAQATVADYSDANTTLNAEGTAAAHLVANTAQVPDGSAIVMLQVTNDGAFPETAVRIADYVTTTGLFTLAETWKGSSAAGTATTVTFAELYALPATVRKVLSVRHQETQLRLQEVDRTQSFDRALPRTHDTIADTPQIILVGGTVTGTSDTTNSTTAVTGLGFQVYPVPTTRYVLHYSYVYQHPDLTATTSTLDSIDDSAATLIVDLAYARSLIAGIGNDAATGFKLEERVYQRLANLNRAQTPDPGRRQDMRSLDEVGGPTFQGFGRMPRNVGSL